MAYVVALPPLWRGAPMLGVRCLLCAESCEHGDRVRLVIESAAPARLEFPNTTLVHERCPSRRMAAAV